MAVDENTPVEEQDLLVDLLWTEKHRPLQLADVALEDQNRAVLQKYIDAGEVPHLLFVGPPGTGKTTLSRILYRGLDCSHIVLNASAERGIDMVREKVGEFVRTITGRRWNVVFLDEADAMTNDAQTALRNMMESYSERARFILTANRQSRIIGAIQSRCQIISLVSPPLKERYRILRRVLKDEGIKAEKSVALGYAERYPDLRHMLMNAQQAYLAQGVLPPVREERGAGGEEVLALVEKKNWTGLRRLTATRGFDPIDGLRDLFWAVPDDHPRVGFLRHVVGKAVHESGFTPDPIILFLGTCAECMEGL